MLIPILFILFEFVYQIHSIPCTTTTLLDFQNNQALTNSRQMASTTILSVVNSNSSLSIRKLNFFF
jgi:hypothetical protein